MKKRLIVLLAVAVVAVVAIVSGINAYVMLTASKKIISPEKSATLEDVDCIIVLGCQVRDNGVPSAMLRDRLDKGIELYELGVSQKLLMSGDHGREEYDEVNTMKQYAVDLSVPSSDVFMDHAGFSTYETVYRAKEIFGANKVVIVTQKYHLYRALYIAKMLGIDAYGVACEDNSYAGQTMRDCREILARCKDFAVSIFKPKPTYLGETISLDGDGDVTNDK